MTTETRPTLRFDHREIAVIFSLFIFVSLLMFTVGILVGKGLSQAKYEGLLLDRTYGPSHDDGAGEPAAGTDPGESAGTSVSTDSEHPDDKAPAEDKAAPEPPEANAAAANPAQANAVAPATANPNGASAATDKAANPTSQIAASADIAGKNAPAASATPLQLVPKAAPRSEIAGSSLREPPRSKEADELLNNPKLRGLVETDAPAPPAGRRAPAAAGPKASAPAAVAGRFPASFSKGAFTVLVNSYASEKSAAERVEALKKLGFPYAFFSAKQWDETKETLYRVWLGYYPDYESASKSGRALQERGEVLNYLVKRSDSSR
jgi:hypothetical protein